MHFLSDTNIYQIFISILAHNISVYLISRCIYNCIIGYGWTGSDLVIKSYRLYTIIRKECNN